MKKLLLMLVVIATATTGAFAQLSGGVKAGLNLANVSGDDAGDTDMRPSFHVGGYVNFAFSENLALQPELLFNSVGTKYTSDFDGIDVDWTQKLTYLSVPVNLVYSFGKFNIQAGPQLSLLLAAKLKGEAGGEEEEEDNKDDFKGTDFGFNLGFGANFGKFNATARYNLGLSSIIDADDVDVKNTAIQLSIGYKLFGGE